MSFTRATLFGRLSIAIVTAVMAGAAALAGEPAAAPPPNPTPAPAPEPPKPAAAPQWVDLLPICSETAPLKVVKVTGGVQTTQEADQGFYEARAALKPPFTIECVAHTNSTNIRFYYGSGHYIFNWEVNQNYLHVRSPLTGQDVPDKRNTGKVTPGQWHRFVWTVRADGQTMAVDDRLVFELKEDYTKTEGRVAVGAAWKSVVTVNAFRVQTADPANLKALADAAKARPDEKKPEEKKPEEKKPEENKPPEKRPDEKPPGESDY